MARAKLHGRLAIAARWPFGIALTGWRYLWRTTPTHRREVPGSPVEDWPPALPAGAEGTDVQGAEDGVGPLIHRWYRARVREAELSADELMARIADDLDRVAPSEFAKFVKVHGDSGGMRAGDKYVVRMPGPWDGPVRVVDATPTSFRVATLKGHLEAGQLQLSASGDRQDLRLVVESWTRPGDRLSSLLHHALRVGREVQLHMWSSVLERAAELSGGRLDGGLDIHTRRVSDEMLRAAGRGGGAAPSALRQLATLEVNFDPEALDEDGRWDVDERRQELPSEGPGDPESGGPWETARNLVRDYAFADPALVRVAYDPRAPLEGRDMLLEVLGPGRRLRVGCRVVATHEGPREVGGRQAYAFGWSYRTLRGHFEMGETSYEVLKWADSGAVEFRVRRVARPSPDPSAVVRAGFRVLGRLGQKRFTRVACERMARLTDAELRRAATQRTGQPGAAPGAEPVASATA